ncbi:MAG: L-serine ammonia-lyase, partial [Erysipelotrichales bacterium]|nr:L-serine ammonia-lyase [Erysipelotrichales bacterium]
MESLKELYRVGPGPSSSHTLAIKRICQYYLERFGKDAPYDVTLYGSLALTGKGHMTDKIVLETLGENDTNIRFSTVWDEHPNTIKIVSAHHELTFFSVGGGAFTIKGEPSI